MAPKKDVVSRQRKWARKKFAEGNCMVCGKPGWLYTTKAGRVKRSGYCEKHLTDVRERQRIRVGVKRHFAPKTGWQV